MATRKTKPAGRAAQVLEKALSFYVREFGAEGQAYLEQHGIAAAGVAERHGLGYGRGNLREGLPSASSADSVRGELRALGVFDKAGRERLAGRVVAPVRDLDGALVCLVGLPLDSDGASDCVQVPPDRTGIWNVAAARTYPELTMAATVLDGLSLEAAGYANAVAMPDGVGPTELEALAQTGVVRVTLVGERPGLAARLRAVFACTVVRLPAECTSVNALLLAEGAAALARRIDDPGQASPTASTPQPVTAPADRTIEPVDDRGFVLRLGLRRYQVMGLTKTDRALRVTVRIEHAGRLHVDTLDLYCARARKALSQDVARVFELPADAVEADLARLVGACERYEGRSAATCAATPQMTAAEREEARRFGAATDLPERIVADYARCGVIGEEANKLVCYLAAVSRRMPEPLSVLILSSSGAGKTRLQDATLRLCPPEDVVRLTALTGRSLFYRQPLSLKHKALALEEGAGAEEATYAIRNLITARELSIEATVRDPGTGRLTTMENRVEGPTAVFLTTAQARLDPETQNRFITLGINESAAQTAAILAFQRQRCTLRGLEQDRDLAGVLRRHHNFQRLLQPVAVVNPYAGELTYADCRLQARRDQPKYLNLIAAVAFLRQMRKQVRAWPDGGGGPAGYVEVDVEDIRLANRLANEVLVRSTDELSVPARDLLGQIAAMTAARAAAIGPDVPPGLVAFSRREVREHTGWSNYRVHVHLGELLELEFVVVDSRRNGYRYRLVSSGFAGVNLGLKNADLLVQAG